MGVTGAVWTGGVPVGGNWAITVANPYSGSQVIAITDATTAAGGNCPARSGDARCTATVNVVIPALTTVKTANTVAAGPGSVVGYNVSVTDSGRPATAALVTDDLTGVLNDVTTTASLATTEPGSVVRYTTTVRRRLDQLHRRDRHQQPHQPAGRRGLRRQRHRTAVS